MINEKSRYKRCKRMRRVDMNASVDIRDLNL